MELVVSAGEPARAAARRFASEHSLTPQAAARLASHVEATRRNAESDGTQATATTAADTKRPLKGSATVPVEHGRTENAAHRGSRRGRIRGHGQQQQAPWCPAAAGQERAPGFRQHLLRPHLPVKPSDAAHQHTRHQPPSPQARKEPEPEPMPEPMLESMPEPEPPVTGSRDADYKLEKYRSKLNAPGLPAAKRREYEQKLHLYSQIMAAHRGPLDRLQAVNEPCQAKSPTQTDAERWKTGRTTAEAGAGIGHSPCDGAATSFLGAASELVTPHRCTRGGKGRRVDVGAEGSTPKQVRAVAGLGGKLLGAVKGGRLRAVDGRLRSIAPTLQARPADSINKYYSINKCHVCRSRTAVDGSQVRFTTMQSSKRSQRTEWVGLVHRCTQELMERRLHVSRCELRDARQPWSNMTKAHCRDLEVEIANLERLAMAAWQCTSHGRSRCTPGTRTCSWLPRAPPQWC